VLVLGASGRTGREVVSQALASGFEVTAFDHDPKELKLTRPHLSNILGDALVPADLHDALRGQYSVISTIGSRDIRDLNGSALAESLIQAMSAVGVNRAVIMSSFVVATNYRPPWYERLVHPTEKAFGVDMAQAEALFRGSQLDWTIVRATRLRNGESRRQIRLVGDHENVNWRYSVVRADVARFLLGLIERPDSIRQVLLVTGRP
jgi:uncharacterized protein YbjT (DUF2867 family)